jgi:hypothetical protein
LTLRRLASVKRLAGLGLWRKLFRERRQHARTTGSARAGPCAGRHGTAALFKGTSGRATGAAGRARRECSSLRGLLRAHGLARAGTAHGTLGSLTKGTRSSMCGAGKRAAVACGQWRTRGHGGARRGRSCARWSSGRSRRTRGGRLRTKAGWRRRGWALRCGSA